MITAWHFCEGTAEAPRLRDGRTVVIGEWLYHVGELRICASGFHACRKPFDCLEYATGMIACYCEISPELIEEGNKLVTRARRVIAAIDAGEILRVFAREQALSVIHLWDAPQMVIDYLTTGSESLSAAASDAAWAAANDAVWAAASDAATSAAASAAASDTAASTAASAAASAAARAVTRVDAWVSANTELESLLRKEMKL